MKVVVAAFNQEKALVGAFSVITNLWMELFQALVEDDGTGVEQVWAYWAIHLRLSPEDVGLKVDAWQKGQWWKEISFEGLFRQ